MNHQGFLLSLNLSKPKDMSNISLENEIWNPIQNYEGYYEVSTLGRIKANARIGVGYGSKPKEKILKQAVSIHGYNIKTYCKKAKFRTFPTHRLVALAFIPNPNNFPEVNHKDGNKLNNQVSNLEWCTKSYNIRHSFQIGIRTVSKGKDHVSSRKVNQLTLDGKFIKTWNAIREIERVTGYYNTNIRVCCQGKVKSSHGFKWEFAS